MHTRSPLVWSTRCQRHGHRVCDQARDGKLWLPLRHARPEHRDLGDTNPTQATIDACRGCDVLIHEVHTSAWLDALPDEGGAAPGTFADFPSNHTTTAQLADLARQASRIY